MSRASSVVPLSGLADPAVVLDALELQHGAGLTRDDVRRIERAWLREAEARRTGHLFS